jgi:hypothetical protein
MWVLGGIVESFPQLGHHHVEAVLKISELNAVPEARTQLVAAYQLAGPFEQSDEQLRRLGSELDSVAVFLQPFASRIEDKRAES